MASVELHLQTTAQISFPDVNIIRNKRTTIAFNQDIVTRCTSQLRMCKCTLTTTERTMLSNVKDFSGKKKAKIFYFCQKFAESCQV